jgi:hypothetical protein
MVIEKRREIFEPPRPGMFIVSPDYRGPTFGPFDAALEGLARVRSHLKEPVYGVYSQRQAGIHPDLLQGQLGDDEILAGFLCASGATDGAKCATPGTAATGLCVRR